MPSPRDNPGVIAPPPLIFAGMLGIALAIDVGFVRVRTGLPSGLRYVLAAVLLLGAGVLIAAALGRFRRAGTDPQPWRPTTAIVTDGVYGVTRNPMYLGMTLAYAGLALAADSALALVLLLPLLALVTVGVIAREERYLDAKFGDEYRRYREKVRRWL